MTVLEAIQRSTEFLARKGIESPRLQVELLLAHLLKLPRLKLYLNFDRPLATEEMDALRELVKRRGLHEPLQHLVGSTSFCGCEITVNPDVLVPRPETEWLAERAWKFLQSLSSEPRALDFGTGSGCIAIAAATQAPKAGFVGMDASAAALKIARENAARNGVAGRIEFVQARSLRELNAGWQFDLIISNPPYIPSAEIATLAPEVRDFDPRLALDGGEDGLNFYRQLAVEAPERLRPGGTLMLEFGDGQAEPVREILRGANWEVEAIEKDLSGRDRILVARRAEA